MIRPSNRASIRNISDYSPFGVQLAERTISGDGYRFGFQGQEKDDEVKGEGNSVNYKYRMHDPRVGRFFAVDPLSAEYPFYSPYVFSGNRVIDAIELEGLEPIIMNGLLVGYTVQSGQGAWSLLKDINNSETSEKYGYNLHRKVTYNELIKYNKESLSNTIHKGDVLSLVPFVAEQILANRIRGLENENDFIQYEIGKNEDEMFSIDQKVDKLEEKVKENNETIGDPDQGDPKGGHEAAKIVKNVPLWKKEIELENRKGDLKDENRVLKVKLKANNALVKELRTKLAETTKKNISSDNN
jgi:RHS repeat-associated protein